ncbi:hypothetical protein RHAB21_02504 [Pseudorhizobium halotolerans]|uniref:Uncharacterized protein n=1 Tax=Pseudorhizobium halotolerans TaxID=1233081 RepID=A0ABN7JML8_9HYPH|nr:hypothetical protein RHAB21_02504 [Pseudorhizobium halotolerans]
MTDYPGNTVEDVPKAYASVLLAEISRASRRIRGDLPNLADVAGKWLLANSRLDENGVVGWGVPVAWDAYGDGSVNPVNTSYAISTGIVVDALLTWMEASATAPAGEIRAVTEQALAAYADPMVRTASGLIPYSLRPSDRAYDTFNSAAYIAGQMQRFASYASSPEIADLLKSAADATMASLIAHHQESPGGAWFWKYSLQENVANDLAHASYIVEGIQTYVREGGALNKEIATSAVSQHLEEFGGNDGTLRGWPTFQDNIDAPARLYDVGMALVLGCNSGPHEKLEEQAKKTAPLHRTDQGFSRYPVGVDDPDLIVKEYETYLWRGMVACAPRLPWSEWKP